MVVSYYDILEAMKQKQRPFGAAPEDDDSKAMEAIRAGMNLRNPNEGDFWDDFLTVIGNADTIAALLDVPRHKVTGWHSRISELINKVSQQDGEDSENQKDTMLPTGDEDIEDIASQDEQPPFNMKPEPS